MINILLLGAGKRVSLAEYFLKAGEEEGCAVQLFSYELDSAVPIRQYAKILKGGKWSSPNFEQELHTLIQKHDIHVILPLMDDAAVALAKIKEGLQKVFKNLAVVVSSEEVCRTFYDKRKAERWFMDRDVLIPRGYSDGLDSSSENGTFPRIAKLRTGFGSRGLVKIESAAELDLFLRAHDPSQYLLQNFIDGDEFTVDAYLDRDRRVLGAVSRKRLEVVGGEVSKSVTIRQPELLTEAERILSSDGFVGPVTLQAIKSEIDGRFYFLEINPRFGGGVIHSLKAGANFVRLLVREYLGRENRPVVEWQENLIMMRANREFWVQSDADHN